MDNDDSNMTYNTLKLVVDEPINSYDVMLVPNNYNENNDSETDGNELPMIFVKIDDTDNAAKNYLKLTSKVNDCSSFLDTSYFTDELSSYYNSLGDDTKSQISTLSTRLGYLSTLLSSSLDDYLNVDEEKYKKLLDLATELVGFNSAINPLLSYATKEQIETVDSIKKGMIDKFGLDENSEEAKLLKSDIDTFLLDYNKDYCSDKESLINNNISILQFFLDKIPDNYKEMDTKYNWGSATDKSKEKNGYNTECEWIEVNGVKFRFTRLTDNNSSYKTLTNYANKAYCYDLASEFSSWEPNMIELLKKREYIDIVVPDYESPYGAAYYQPSTPYNDHIVLPTKMNGGFVYENEGTYSYLKNCLVHEMSHYIDDICGVTQSESNPNETYRYIEKLANEHMYDLQLINHHGSLSEDEEKTFRNFKVGKDANFCESMAEFLRADLVDHDAFVDAIGEESYNKLFAQLKAGDGWSDVSTKVQIGDNNSVSLTVKHDDIVTSYVDGVPVNETYVDNGKTVASNYEYEYFDDGGIKASNRTSSNGDISRMEYYSNGDLKLSYNSYSNGNNQSRRAYYPDGGNMYVHNIFGDGSEDYCECNENGDKTFEYSIKFNGDKTECEYKYDDDNNMIKKIKTTSNSSGYSIDEYDPREGTEKCNQYDEKGDLIFSRVDNADGSAFSTSYKNKIKTDSYERYPNGDYWRKEFYENGNLKRSTSYTENGGYVYEEFYSNGTIESRTSLDSECHYYPSGVLKSKNEFHDKGSTYHKYDINSNLLKTIEMEYVGDGKKYYEYDKDGILLSTAEEKWLDDGGYRFEYNKDGELIRTIKLPG